MKILSDLSKRFKNPITLRKGAIDSYLINWQGHVLATIKTRKKKKAFIAVGSSP